MSDVLHLIEDPNDSWARVELFRWQHGHLPGEAGTDRNLELDVGKALTAMAEAFEHPDPTEWPTKMNLISVLKYVGKLKYE